MTQTTNATSPSNYDLIVIGAGPGGYVAAIRAAQLGMKVGCVEREFLGGTCLNIGCIPSKALLDSSERYYAATHDFAKHGINLKGELAIDLAKMMARKDEVVKGLTGGVGFLFKKHKIDHLKGHGTIAAPNAVQVTDSAGATQSYQTQRILIATGSAPIQIPGLTFDGKHVLSSTEALSLTEVPKRMVLVGGGYIGLELGSVWSRLGSEVLVLEFLDGILPASDRECAAALQKQLEKQGLKFRFRTIAQTATVENGRVKVAWKCADANKNESGVEEVDRVMVAVGRRPVTDKLGLENVAVALDKKGYIPVDAHYQTSAPGVYAIGDVIGGLMLAH